MADAAVKKEKKEEKKKTSTKTKEQAKEQTKAEGVSDEKRKSRFGGSRDKSTSKDYPSEKTTPL